MKANYLFVANNMNYDDANEIYFNNITNDSSVYDENGCDYDEYFDGENCTFDANFTVSGVPLAQGFK